LVQAFNNSENPFKGIRVTVVERSDGHLAPSARSSVVQVPRFLGEQLRGLTDGSKRPLSCRSERRQDQQGNVLN